MLGRGPGLLGVSGRAIGLGKETYTMLKRTH